MDLQMPEMDGLEATRIIRQTYGDRPFIIALTANAMPEDRENCMNSKMNDFITKPINLELLTQSLLSLYSTAHHS
jgi:CheY-like chemotaxis protein